MFSRAVASRRETNTLFYTGHNLICGQRGFPSKNSAGDPPASFIGRRTNFVFEAPDWLEMHVSATFVFFDEEKRKYCMLIAGRLKNGDPVFSKA
ncbi:MAG: hypothetical protein ACLRSW_03625 [Christensenellaceae bacterium]